MSRWYSDIFDWMHLLFTQVHLFIDGSVEGQYVARPNPLSDLFYRLNRTDI